MTFQNKISISIIGAGGLGTPAALELVNAWPEELELNLKIYDPDKIELSNLNRQILFGEGDLNKFKAETLALRLKELVNQSTINISHYNFAINKDNISKEIENSDFILDTTDSVSTKFLINDFCIANKKIFCYAGSVKTSGQLLFVNPKNHNNACLRCLFGSFSEEEIVCQDETCQDSGVLGPAVGFIGALQANYIINYIKNPDLLSNGSIFHSFDLNKSHQRKTTIKASKNCSIGCNQQLNKILDLRAHKCPKTFLFTKLAIEEIKNEEILDVRFCSNEYATNVMKSIEEEGHKNITSMHEIAHNNWRVLIQRGN